MKGMKLYNRSTIYHLALKNFGPEAQALKLMEESAELAAAAARNMNGLGNEVDLAGEMADVEIMIEQFRINGMGKLIDFQKQKKLERLAERLGVTYAAE
jgi:NTP pyrophosphatase (non-canonical NTP hydrolase)